MWTTIAHQYLQPQNQPHQLLPCLAHPLLSHIVISDLDHHQIPIKEAQKLRQGQLLPLGQHISIYNHCSSLSKALPLAQLLLPRLSRGLFHFVISMQQSLEVECIAFVQDAPFKHYLHLSVLVDVGGEDLVL